MVDDARETHFGSAAPYFFSLIYPDRLKNNTQISRDETAQMYNRASVFCIITHIIMTYVFTWTYNIQKKKKKKR